MRPASTPSSHSSPMLSNVRPASASSLRCAAPFRAAASQDRTLSRSFADGLLPLHPFRPRIPTSAAPRRLASAVLYATYAGERSRGTDVENLLFNNIDQTLSLFCA